MVATKQPSTSTPDIPALLDKTQGNVYPAMLEHLGEHLGVSANSLCRLALGWAPIVEFKKGKNFMGWWAIPERDDTGAPIGLSLRSQNDMKVMLPGSKHGLVYEVNPEHERGSKGYEAGAHNWIRTMDAGVPCPICGKPDGCVLSAENPLDPKAVICIREKAGAVRPMKFGFLHIRKAEGQLTGRSALADNGGPVIVVEGMSDAAAAMDLGYNSVGRPSNLACMALLANLVRGRSVIIVGENDKKADGKEPGREGMIAAFQAVRNVCRDVKMVMPPDHIKDLRAWRVKYGLTRDQFDAHVADHGQTTVPAPTTAEISALCTDTGNNARFVRQNGENVLLNHGRGQWLIWNGQRWQYDLVGAAEGLAKKTALGIFGEAQAELDDARRTALAKHAVASQRRERIGALLALSRSDLAVMPDQLDADPLLLNVENGTVDLSTGTIYPHNRAHRITKICRAAYAPNAQAPLFRKFLARIFRTHPALIDYMQRVIGYAATGLTTEQAFFFMHGGGQNGKTTLFDIATYILGDYAGKAAPDLLMTRDKSAHPCDVADLQGLRLAVASETREGRRFDGARLKELTGETRLKARLMRENFFEFTPTHKVFLYSNHKPIVQETDFGFWRRMRLIPFVESIGEHEKDPDLLDKLKAEADGILAWIVAGAVRWHREGLGTPPEVAAATHEYRTEMDTIGAFLGECCVEDKDAAVYATPIYETYRRWAEEHGERVESQKRFGTLLRERGYRSDRCSRTGRQVWYGIRVNETTTSGRIIFN